MIRTRSFLYVYSPLITLGLAVAGLFVMAASIGVSLCGKS